MWRKYEFGCLLYHTRKNMEREKHGRDICKRINRSCLERQMDYAIITIVAVLLTGVGTYLMIPNSQEWLRLLN